jgi:septum formation protein
MSINTRQEQQERHARIILASGSFYRRELLNRLGLSFDVISPEIDETPKPHESPEKTATRLAQCKAMTVSHNHPDALIIGSDQVAMLDGEQIGKPGSHEAALKQLQRMRGREVVFHTAVCLLDGRHDSTVAMQIENVQTVVCFRQLDDASLNNYLLIEKPYDCAGSAKNEGLGIALMERIVSSDPTALTGLPLIALSAMLMKTGVRLF